MNNNIFVSCPWQTTDMAPTADQESRPKGEIKKGKEGHGKELENETNNYRHGSQPEFEGAWINGKYFESDKERRESLIKEGIIDEKDLDLSINQPESENTWINRKYYKVDRKKKENPTKKESINEVDYRPQAVERDLPANQPEFEGTWINGKYFESDSERRESLIKQGIIDGKDLDLPVKTTRDVIKTTNKVVEQKRTNILNNKQIPMAGTKKRDRHKRPDRSLEYTILNTSYTVEVVAGKKGQTISELRRETRELEITNKYTKSKEKNKEKKETPATRNKQEKERATRITPHKNTTTKKGPNEESEEKTKENKKYTGRTPRRMQRKETTNKKKQRRELERILKQEKEIKKEYEDIQKRIKWNRLKKKKILETMQKEERLNKELEMEKEEDQQKEETKTITDKKKEESKAHKQSIKNKRKHPKHHRPINKPSRARNPLKETTPISITLDNKKQTKQTRKKKEKQKMNKKRNKKEKKEKRRKRKNRNTRKRKERKKPKIKPKKQLIISYNKKMIHQKQNQADRAQQKMSQEENQTKMNRITTKWEKQSEGNNTKEKKSKKRTWSEACMKEIKEKETEEALEENTTTMDDTLPANKKYKRSPPTEDQKMPETARRDNNKSSSNPTETHHKENSTSSNRDKEKEDWKATTNEEEEDKNKEDQESHQIEDGSESEGSLSPTEIYCESCGEEEDLKGIPKIPEVARKDNAKSSSNPTERQYKESNTSTKDYKKEEDWKEATSEEKKHKKEESEGSPQIEKGYESEDSLSPTEYYCESCGEEEDLKGISRREEDHKENEEKKETYRKKEESQTKETKQQKAEKPLRATPRQLKPPIPFRQPIHIQETMNMLGRGTWPNQEIQIFQPPQPAKSQPPPLEQVIEEMNANISEEQSQETVEHNKAKRMKK